MNDRLRDLKLDFFPGLNFDKFVDTPTPPESEFFETLYTEIVNFVDFIKKSKKLVFELKHKYREKLLQPSKTIRRRNDTYNKPEYQILEGKVRSSIKNARLHLDSMKQKMFNSANIKDKYIFLKEDGLLVPNLSAEYRVRKICYFDCLERFSFVLKEYSNAKLEYREILLRQGKDIINSQPNIKKFDTSQLQRKKNRDDNVTNKKENVKKRKRSKRKKPSKRPYSKQANRFDNEKSDDVELHSTSSSASSISNRNSSSSDSGYITDDDEMGDIKVYKMGNENQKKQETKRNREEKKRKKKYSKPKTIVELEEETKEIEEEVENENVMVNPTLVILQKLNMTSHTETMKLEKELELETRDALLEVNSEMNEINDLFQDCQCLLDQQGLNIDRIEDHVYETVLHVQKGRKHIKRATKRRGNSRVMLIMMIICATILVMILVLFVFGSIITFGRAVSAIA